MLPTNIFSTQAGSSTWRKDYYFVGGAAAAVTCMQCDQPTLTMESELLITVSFVESAEDIPEVLFRIMHIIYSI